MRFLITKAIVFFSLLMIQCSKVSEQVLSDEPDHLELSPQTIHTTLPVVNLDVNQVAFDEMFNNYESPIEIDGNLFMYRNGALVINNEEVDIEIKGSHTTQFPIKQLGITFEETFDNSNRDLLKPLKILPIHNLDSIKAFRLRNSGNDLYKTMVKDMSYTQLAIDAGLNIDLTYGEQVVVFVNNVFYGVMDLRSEGNAKGMSRLHQTDKANINLLKIENPGVLVYKDGDFGKIEAVVNAIAQKDFAYLYAHIDISNFIDYMIFQSFIANHDWPYNNVRLFSIGEGPFRFVLFDLDWCNTLSLKEDPVFFIDPVKENIITDLFYVLNENESFTSQYEARYSEIIDLPELTPEHFNSIVDLYTANIKKEMVHMVEKYATPASLLEWYREIDILKLHYKKRFDYFQAWQFN